MYYTNILTITTENHEMASKILEIMKKRLETGFECDNLYKHNPSIRMANDLRVQDNTIVLPEECGYYQPEEANIVFTEIMEELAASLNEEKFTCYIYNNSDYSESELEAHFKKKELESKVTYNSFV